MVSRYTRLPEWPKRLSAAVSAAGSVPFAWGSHDCALFAAEVIQAFTGVDLAAGVRGLYRDAAGAERVMSAVYGTTDLGEIATILLGDPIPIELAGRGDLVLMDVATGQALGICTGAEAAGAGPGGLTMVPMRHWHAAWRV